MKYEMLKKSQSFFKIFWSCPSTFYFYFFLRKKNFLFIPNLKISFNGIQN